MFQATHVMSVTSVEYRQLKFFWKYHFDASCCLFYISEESVCQSDYFRARCMNSDEIIVVTKAHYGRMRMSRCVKENFGYVGCSNDVLDIMDGQCSGKRECSVRILDENFLNAKPCHEDLKSYLHIFYSCIKGWS